MWNAERQTDLDRIHNLLENDPKLRQAELAEDLSTPKQEIPSDGLSLKIFQAGLRIHRSIIIFVAIVSGTAFGLLFSQILSAYLVPLYIAAGFYLPFAWLEGRVSKRAANFAEDYSTVLLATASSVKVGLTAYLALERSIRLLPKGSLVREEVERLVGALRHGESKEEALRHFAASIRLPDLPLFRTAFLLVLEQGGRFAPTLNRLAMVGRDRQSLISGAEVSTANMRMTANILIVLVPVILLIVSSRNEDYWTILLNDPVASTMSSIGIVTITGCYALLRKMSAFKP